jgi:hypothetical protein
VGIQIQWAQNFEMAFIPLRPTSEIVPTGKGQHSTSLEFELATLTPAVTVSDHRDRCDGFLIVDSCGHH